MYSEIDRYVEYLDECMYMHKNTFIKYRLILLRFRNYLIEAASGERGNEVITSKGFEDYICTLLERNEARGSIYNAFIVLKNLFYFSGIELVVEKSIVDEFWLFRHQEKEPKSVSEKELDVIIENCKLSGDPTSLRDIAMMEMVWSTGMGYAELAFLDLDSVKVVGEKVLIRYPSSQKEYMISSPLSFRATSSLYSYIHKCRRFSHNKGDENPLFMSVRGKRINKSGVRSAFKKRIIESDIEHINLKMFWSSYFYRLKNGH